MKKIGALEAGGTKMVLAVYDEAGRELERLTLPTETPDKTMPPMQAFFRDHGIDALGVGSFGPLALGKADPNYGAITTTPKLAWRDYPLLQRLTEGLDIPSAIDTDVNAAALAAPNGLYDEGTLTPQERKHVVHAVEVTGTHARYAAALFDGIQLRRGAVVPHQLRKNDLVVEQTVVRLVYLTGADPIKLGEILLFVVVLKVVKGDLIHHVPAEDRIPYAKVQRDAEVVRCEQYPYYPACCRQQPAEK